MFRKDWKIITVVPEDDFIGVIKRTNRIVLIISLILLVIAIVPIQIQAVDVLLVQIVMMMTVGMIQAVHNGYQLLIVLKKNKKSRIIEIIIVRELVVHIVQAVHSGLIQVVHEIKLMV